MIINSNFCFFQQMGFLFGYCFRMSHLIAILEFLICDITQSGNNILSPYLTKTTFLTALMPIPSRRPWNVPESQQTMHAIETATVS